MTWPPPNPVARLISPRRRRAADIDFQQLLRAAVMFVIVLAAMVAVAGGAKALFLL